MSDQQVPRHVAIIPDGNRRWAKEKGKKPWEGHEVAAQNLEEISGLARDRGMTHLTMWGSSLENLEKRPLREKAALLDIYERYFKKLLNSQEVKNGDLCIRIIGRWRSVFPKHLVKILEEGISRTADNVVFNLTLCLAYSGDDEMLGAVKSIVDENLSAPDISAAVLKNHLMTRDLPAVDYLIRTGGEPHLSVGFMMWDIANAQLFFSEKLCPDFGADAFGEALDEYGRRARRHGA